MGISRDRAYVWWRRYQARGPRGTRGSFVAPHRSPNQTRPSREHRIVRLRKDRGLGPARIAGIVGMPASTVHRVLVRHGLNRLDHLDRVTRAPIRRIVMTRPGELVHVDIKKLGRIPKGGGWRATRARTRRIDQPRDAKPGRLRIRPHRDRRPLPPRLQRGRSTTNKAEPRRVHGPSTRVPRRPRHHRRTRPHRQRSLLPRPRLRPPRSTTSPTPSPGPTGPRPTAKSNASTAPFSTNGPTPAWTSEGQRNRALARWLHTYNHHRHHTAIDGPPISQRRQPVWALTASWCSPGRLSLKVCGGGWC